MPITDTLDISIDPRTGNTHLAEGTAVIVEDELGKQHRGYITFVEGDQEPVFTVLITCKGEPTELEVREDRILARVAGGYEK